MRLQPDLHAGPDALADLHGGEIEPVQRVQHGRVGPGGEGVEQVERALGAGQGGLPLAQARLGHRRP